MSGVFEVDKGVVVVNKELYELALKHIEGIDPKMIEDIEVRHVVIEERDDIGQYEYRATVDIFTANIIRSDCYVKTIQVRIPTHTYRAIANTQVDCSTWHNVHNRTNA